MIDFRALGKNFTNKGEIEVVQHDFGPTSAIGIGNVKDFNEDCLRLGKNDNYFYLVITDGHWGGESAEYMIGTIIDELNSRIHLFVSSGRKQDVKEEIFSIVDYHNQNIAQKSESETTFLYCYIAEDFVCWVSVGDSFLYIIDENNKILENKKFQSWIGKRIIHHLNDQIDVGMYEGKWLSISLMSDGIPECIYGKETISTEMIIDELEKSNDSKEFVQNLCEKALSHGGEDNIAMISLFRA